MEYWMAPMERVTDCAFRTLVHGFGADMTVTPFVKLYSLLRGMEKATLRFDLLNETPTQVQVMTNDLKETRRFVEWFNSHESLELPERNNLLSKKMGGQGRAESVVDLSRVKGFNLNLCCPDPYIVRTGRGAALVKRTKRVCDLVEMLKETGVDVSLKMRLGLNERQKEQKVYLRLVERCEADQFVVHARHGRESYDDPADPSVFPELVETGKFIVANCDVKSGREAERFEEMGVGGVMVGRAAVVDPQLFSRLKGREAELSEKEVKKRYEELAFKYDVPVQNYRFVSSHLGHKFEHRS